MEETDLINIYKGKYFHPDPRCKTIPRGYRIRENREPSSPKMLSCMSNGGKRMNIKDNLEGERKLKELGSDRM